MPRRKKPRRKRPGYSIPPSLIPPPPPPGYPGVSSQSTIPGGASAVPGAPEGTVSTNPKSGLFAKQAKANRIKAKKAFGDEARKAFRTEYGSDWKSAVYGKQAGQVKPTYETGIGNMRSVYQTGTPGGDRPAAEVRKTAAQLRARFVKAARELGVKAPPRPKKAKSGFSRGY